MATFKVGQTVKRVAVVSPRVPIGTVGTVIGGPFVSGPNNDRTAYAVNWANGAGGDHDRWYDFTLAPLTDPKADEFIETVKRWGPLHEEPKRKTLADLVNELDRLLDEK